MINIKESPNNRKIFLQIANLNKINKNAIRKAFYYIGKDLVVTSKREIMKKPKHGIIYRVAKGGRVINHIASAPGEAPANLTGALNHSIQFEIQGADTLEFGSDNSVKYGGYLEKGTTKMAAHPYLELSVKNNYGNIQKHFEVQLDKSLNKSPWDSPF